jgi:hypothetical protein
MSRCVMFMLPFIYKYITVIYEYMIYAVIYINVIYAVVCDYMTYNNMIGAPTERLRVYCNMLLYNTM